MEKTAILTQVMQMFGHGLSWHEFKAELDKQGITQLLDTDSMNQIIDMWQENEASHIADYKLCDELDFWAKGGSYKTHLEGFLAIKPIILVKEAQKRGWFVKELGEKFIINPPDKSPIIIKV